MICGEMMIFLEELNDRREIAEFIKRILTGTVFVAATFFSCWHSPAAFSIFISFIGAISIIEWYKINKNSFFFRTLTVLYPTIPLVTLLVMRFSFPDNFAVTLYPFIVVWIGDSFGYLFGKLFGFHKIFPKISPKKSLEGTLAGLVFTFLFNYFFTDVRLI